MHLVVHSRACALVSQCSHSVRLCHSGGAYLLYVGPHHEDMKTIIPNFVYAPDSETSRVHSLRQQLCVCRHSDSLLLLPSSTSKFCTDDFLLEGHLFCGCSLGYINRDKDEQT